MTGELYTIEVSDASPGGPLVNVTGEIDASNARRFQGEVAALLPGRPIVVDVSGVGYLDSAGLRALEALLSERRLAIVLRSSSVVRRAAELTCLPIHDDVESALASLRG